MKQRLNLHPESQTEVDFIAAAKANKLNLVKSMLEIQPMALQCVAISQALVWLMNNKNRTEDLIPLVKHGYLDILAKAEDHPSGNTILHLACELQDQNLLEKILSRADTNIKKISLIADDQSSVLNTAGQTPMQIAAQCSDPLTKFYLLRTLAAYGVIFTIQDLHIVIENINQQTGFTKLILHDLNLSADSDVDPLCAALQDNDSLLELCMHRLKIDGQAAGYNLLAAALQNTTRIQIFDISNCLMSAEVFKELAAVLSHNKSILELNLSSCGIDSLPHRDIITNLFEQNKTIKKLVFQDNPVSVDIALAGCLKSNSALIEVVQGEEIASLMFRNELKTNQLGPQVEYNELFYPQLVTLVLIRTIFHGVNTAEFSSLSLLPMDLLLNIFSMNVESHFGRGFFVDRDFNAARFRKFVIDESNQTMLSYYTSKWFLKNNINKYIFDHLSAACESWDRDPSYRMDDDCLELALDSHKSEYFGIVGSKQKLMIIDFLLRYRHDGIKFLEQNANDTNGEEFAGLFELIRRANCIIIFIAERIGATKLELDDAFNIKEFATYLIKSRVEFMPEDRRLEWTVGEAEPSEEIPDDTFDQSTPASKNGCVCF